MNSKIEILLYGTSGSTAVGVLDLFGDEPITLQMSVADVKDIKQRKSTFSQSFTVPGTKNNNVLFNSIYNIGVDSQFDPRKKTAASILVDGIPVLQNGNLQLTGINVDDNKNIIYEVSIFDQSEDFISLVGDTEITDLDFSELSHVWCYSAVTQSWTGTDKPYVYPFIDYGYDWSVSDLQTGSGATTSRFFPAIQLKYIIDKTFEINGFTYNSDLFNSNYFKNLYIPFSGLDKLANEPNFAFSRNYLAHTTSAYTYSMTVLHTGSPFTTFNTPETILPCNDNLTPPNFDNGGLYDISTYTYSADTNVAQTFFAHLELEMNYSSTNLSTTAIPGRVFIKYYRSSNPSVPYSTDIKLLPTFTNATQTIEIQSSGALLSADSGIFKYAQPGETFWVTYSFIMHGQNTDTTNHVASFILKSANTYSYNLTSSQAIPNQFINFNSFLTKKTKVIDVLNSVITMHNLYIEPSKENAKTLNIEPRDFYYTGGTTLDWSNKLDSSVKIKEQLLSEQTNKRIVFTYKADKDFYNDNYTSATNRIFGDEYVNIENDFVASDDKKIEVVFSPTPSVAVLESGAFVPPGQAALCANEFVIPKIGKVDSNNNFAATNFNIRLLQKNDATLIPLDASNYWIYEGVQQTSYPYMGMLSHPSTGTTDISFGITNYQYYSLQEITNNSLVNRYWRNYLDQIIDKDSKLITCNIHLTPEDISSFNFKDLVFIDGLTPDGGHYFYVNKIEYTPTSNATSKVELIKVNKKNVDLTLKRKINSVLTFPLQSIALAGGVTNSTASVAIGPGVLIGNASQGSVAIGQNLTVEGGSRNGFIVGSGSSISAGLQNVAIFGNNITGATGNTLYTNNIYISTGGTINNYSISAITIGSTLWTEGTGAGSLFVDSGVGNSAAGNYALSEGAANSADGLYSHAEGLNNIATGNSAHAEGYFNSAFGDYSHVEGTGNNTYGYASHAEGNSTVASGYSAHAEGYQTEANGVYSHAGGFLSKSNGGYSVAIGAETIANGLSSFASGSATTASGAFSFACNGTTIAFGDSSFAEGQQTLASGNASHSEGKLTQANGDISHAGGYLTQANGALSFAQGFNSQANGVGTIVLGSNITGNTANTVYTANLKTKSDVFPASVGGCIDDKFTTSGNTGGVLTTLYNLTINPNTLVNNGDKIKIKLYGLVGSSFVSYIFNIGGTGFFQNFTLTPAAGSSYVVELILMRKTSTSLNAFANLQGSNSSIKPFQDEGFGTITGLNFTTSLSVLFNVMDTLSNDFTVEFATADFIPAA